MLRPCVFFGRLTNYPISPLGRKKLNWWNLREVDDARKISRC
jgi:hypothetical protein